MQRIVFKAGALAFALAMASQAAAQNAGNQIRELLNKADEVMTKNGYSSLGWAKVGAAEPGAITRFKISFAGGGQLQIVGVCDNDCSDIDAHLYDSNGNEVAKDVEKDDAPIVGTTTAGTYTVQLDMITCKAAPCGFAMKAYKK